MGQPAPTLLLTRRATALGARRLTNARLFLALLAAEFFSLKDVRQSSLSHAGKWAIDIEVCMFPQEIDQHPRDRRTAATDLFLVGRDQDHGIRRGVADANLLMEHGVNCSLSSNNILNPATPYGDCSLIRMANLYANILQIDRAAQLRECFRMLTDRSASLLNIKDYGFGVGNPADVVIMNAQSPEQAIAEIAQPVAVFKNGRQTVRWDLPKLLRPQ